MEVRHDPEDLKVSVMRVRHMSIDLLKLIGEMCQMLEEGAKDAHPAYVPGYPKQLVLAEGGIPGACTARLGLYRVGDGPIERVIALYDEEDDTAPTLILVEEEIGEFIEQVDELVK